MIRLEAPPKPRGKALVRSRAELDALSRMDDGAVEEGRAHWKENAPEGRRDLVDASPSTEGPPKDRKERDSLAAAVLWLLFTRIFRRKGSDVPRPDVRSGVDRVVSASQDESRTIGERLRDGKLDVAGWQREMEGLTRKTHAAAGMIGSGGKRQFGTAHRKAVAAAVRIQLKHLAAFAEEIEGGLPIDEPFFARSAMYPSSATQSYEEALRAGDIRAGFRWERRVRNASVSCRQCLEYEAEGWQAIGKLPGIGQQCSCKSNCKCTFERSRDKARPKDLSMPTDRTPGLSFDREKCQQRRRLAARQGINAIPMRLAASDPPVEGATLVSARGTLARNDEEATGRINEILGNAPDQVLRADQLHVRTLEAGNTNFIPSRWMFLDKSTLRNVAGRASDGFAFMNSHRTGGLSSPAELPYGRTFAGRVETWALPGGGTFARSLVQVYMLRGEQPNGAGGPSTDAMVSGIDAGTVFDVSLGLSRGWAKCDVCGNDLTASDDDGKRLCRHYPGSSYQMGRDQRKAQSDRGVPGGRATYTLMDANPSEVSAVFDGAVPGAGFRKALSAARAGQLPPQALHELRAAYGDLLPTRGRTAAPFHPAKGTTSMPIKLSDLMRLIRGSATEPDVEIEDDEIEDRESFSAVPPKAQPAADPRPSPELLELRKQLAETNKRLAEEKEAREKEARNGLINGFGVDADAFIADQKRANKLNGKQVTELRGLLVNLATDDHDRPIDGFSRVGTVKAILGEVKPHDLTKEQVNGATKPPTATLDNHGDEAYDPEKEARDQNDAFFAARGIKPNTGP
jgi:hypothetical protein